MQVLVTGLLPFDSGKTTVAEFLISEAANTFDVGVSKPVTTLSGWYQYQSVERSIKLGILIGEDIYRLHTAARSSDPIEIEGPIVSLLLPPDPQRVNWNTSFYSSMAFHHQISVVRISTKSETKHYFIPSNVRRASHPLRRRIERLLKILRPSPIEAEEAEYLLLTSKSAADECIEELNLRHELVVIESHSNVAAPTAASLNSELVLVVAPGKLALFHGDEYRRAVGVLTELKEPWRITTEDVLQILKPIDVFDIEPGAGNIPLLDIFEKLS
jgi:predicted P-loop ATPase/GTPase